MFIAEYFSPHNQLANVLRLKSTKWRSGLSMAEKQHSAPPPLAGGEVWQIILQARLKC